MRKALAVPLGLWALLLAGCGGFGVSDAEQKSRAAQKQLALSSSPGLTIWSHGAEAYVRKRLDQGLGKTKPEVGVMFGEPFKCQSNAGSGEVCGYYDAGMSGDNATEPYQHRVYFHFDPAGTSRNWSYEGLYGRYGSRDANLPAPLPAPTTP